MDRTESKSSPEALLNILDRLETLAGTLAQSTSTSELDEIEDGRSVYGDYNSSIQYRMLVRILES